MLLLVVLFRGVHSAVADVDDVVVDETAGVLEHGWTAQYFEQIPKRSVVRYILSQAVFVLDVVQPSPPLKEAAGMSAEVSDKVHSWLMMS